MDLTQKNFKELFIAKDVDRTSNVTPATLAVGEVALFSTTGTLITASNAADFDEAVIMRGTASGDPQRSDRIVKQFVHNAKGVNGKAITEQVSFVGFDGTSGEIEVINDNLYLLRYNFKSFTVSSNRSEYYKHSQWKSALSGNTQEKIAVGLQKSAINNFAKEASKLVTVELINSGTKTALGTGVGAVTFTNGAPTVSVATAIDDATTNAILAVGELIGVGDTYGVIKSIDVANDKLTLSNPWQGSTTTVADSDVDRITVANKGDYGIKVTGVTESASVGKFIPKLTTFDLTTTNFGETPIVTTKGDPGNNTAEVVAQREWFYQGNFGENFRFGGRDLFDSRSEVEGVLYDAINIDWKDQVTVGAIHNIPEKQLEVVIPATRANDQYTAAGSGLKAAFDAFFGITLAI